MGHLVLGILVILMVLAVVPTLLYFSRYSKTKDAIRFGYFRYPLDQLCNYRFVVTVQRRSHRVYHDFVRVRSYRDGALYRDHWIDDWTTRRANTLARRIEQDLQGHLKKEENRPTAG